MDVKELHERGLTLRKQIFGDDVVAGYMSALGEFGEPLQNVVNAYAYGDIWSRSGLSLKSKSLAVLAMTAATGRAQEFRVHTRGALNNGCTPEEIREVLLLVALYCGIPAAIEAHRIACETINAYQAGKT